MDSKERVAAAIARKPVDKVPLGFYAVDYNVIEAVLGRKTYVRNKIKITLAYWDGRRDEVVESLKKDTVEFYRKIDCADIILPKEAPLVPPKGYKPDPPKKIDDNKWEDKEGRIFQASWDSNEMHCIYDPQNFKIYSVNDFQNEPEPEKVDESIFEAQDYIIQEFSKHKYIASIPDFSLITSLGNTENTLLNYGMNPEVVKAATKCQFIRQRYLDKYYIRNGVDGVLLDSDMAGTNGPLISPSMFEEINLPFVKQRINEIKKRISQVLLHSCGNTHSIMHMLIDAGVDCYQSLQTNANMEIGFLKEKYGDKLAFWGGVPVEILISGTTADVRKEVRNAMEKGSPNSGFILGPSHSIAYGTTYDNFMAMLDEFCLCNK